MKAIFIYFRITAILFLTVEFDELRAQDSARSETNKDAIYGRPFLGQAKIGKSTTAIGGYLEGNTNYFATDGVTEGFTMEFRRFNIFLFSEITSGIRFMSELEFEHGTEEINLETALLDFELSPFLILRAGILLPPIGYFNQNHDSPKWDFVERPIVSTALIPSTLSEIGFGFHGNFYKDLSQITYEIYLVNGLEGDIVANDDGRTSLRQGKTGILEEDRNGSPALTGRIGWNWKNLGEAGLSYYGGVYNAYRTEGVIVDKKRRLDLAAFDYNLRKGRMTIRGEIARAWIGVPISLGPQFGKKQWGFHTDIILKVLERRIIHWQNVSLNTAIRTEYVDFNHGKFAETGSVLYDHIFAVVPGICLRFSANTLLRMNYRYEWEKDITGNPYSKTAGFQFGFASYF